MGYIGSAYMKELYHIFQGVNAEVDAEGGLRRDGKSIGVKYNYGTNYEKE